jgi:hypothetical protein
LEAEDSFMNPELGITLIGNGLTIALNSGLSGYFLDDSVDGFGFPNIRTSSGNYSGQPGGYVGKQLAGMRPISLSGRAYATDVASVFELRRNLVTALANFVVSVLITTYDGRSYLVDANVTDFDMPLKDSMNFADFKIELLAPDPIIYDNTTGAELIVPLARMVYGGFSWPIEWPLVWGANSGPVTVTNNGTVFIQPKITLYDVMTNPVLTNRTTGDVFTLAGLTTSPGDVVVIDMKKRSVTLNGGNIFARVAPSSRWWGLVVGPNDITLESGSGSDTVSGLLSYRSGVLGF